jgi:hypothetical protein
MTVSSTTCAVNGEALEEREGARLLPGLRSAAALVFRREAIGINDRGAALPLPDMTAEPERLEPPPN